MCIPRLLTFAFILGLAALAAAQGQLSPPVSPIPFSAVHVDDAFWSPRFETNRTVTIAYDFKKCEETARINNFAVAGKLVEGKFEGIPYNDSDVYKVIEGAAYSLATHPDPALEKYLDDLGAKIAAAQEPDGYLYTARTIIKDGAKMPRMSGPERWMNERSSHELYNVGHFYEAAVAYFEATGKRALLDVAIKNADLIDKVFGPGRLQIPPGHEEIEIGLVKLYRATNNAKYLKLAQFFVDARGRAEGHKLFGDYCQDHQPVIEQSEAVGHAVRAGYLYSGVADVAAQTGDARYTAAIDRIWDNVVTKKLYLTGGIGARHAGEAFGADYELPNKSAYNETCAAIANAFWNQRMFLLHGDAKYIDVLERVIYNGFLSGVSLQGDSFFYPNPLEADPGTKRQPWFGTSCCPVNVVRFIPSIAGCVYATRADALYVNLYLGNRGEVKLNGQTVKLAMQTRYPWEGQVKLTVTPEKAGAFALRLRIPGWAQGRPVPSDLYRYTGGKTEPVTLKLNGAPFEYKLDQGYAVLAREWKAGDTVELNLPMPVRRVLAHENIKDDVGRIAIERGPIVYCAEGVDNDGAVANLCLDGAAPLTPEFKADLLGGLTVLRGKAQAVALDDQGTTRTAPAELTLIPYYAWCHRGAGAMAVWLAGSPAVARPRPAPTLAGLATPSASHQFTQDSLAALNDQKDPRRSGDQAIPRFTWWDHRGTAEWVQYDFQAPSTVAGAEVYWFDDTGRGSCRLPQSWRLLYKSGDQWKPVAGASDYGVKPDAFNRVTFQPVETTALRLEVQLQPKFSGGLLEWRVVK